MGKDKRNLTIEKTAFIRGGIIICSIYLLLASCSTTGQGQGVFVSAEEGIIDLTKWDFDTHGIAALTGEYRFKWEDESAPWETIEVPSNWNSQNRSGFGTGWYFLDVKLKEPAELVLYMEYILTSYDIYIDGVKKSSVGKTREGDDPGFPQRLPQYIELPKSSSFSLVFKVSNYADARGGIFTAPLIGRSDQIRDHTLSGGIDWALLIGILGILVSYHFVLWCYRKKDTAGLYFTFLGITFILRTFVSRVYAIFAHWMPGMEMFWFEFQYKIEYITMAVACFTFLNFMKHLFYSRKQQLIDTIILIGSIVGTILPLVTPISVYSNWVTMYHILIFIGIPRAVFLILRAIGAKQDGGIPLLIGTGIFFLTAIWDIIILSAPNSIPNYMPTVLPYYSSRGLLVLFVIKTFVLSKRYTRAINTAEYLTENLKKEVALRTRELQKANAYQSRFFANISHEFRTPLTLLLGPLEAMIAGEWGKEVGADHPAIDSMYRNTGRLLKLVNNILSYSRIKDDELELQKEWINIKNLLSSYVISIKAAAESKNITLTFTHPHRPSGGKGIWGFVDKELLEQGVLNLLSNALKFTPAEGRIALKLDEDDRWICISVEDTGIGIPEEHIHSIFERYRQLSEAKQKRYEGSGIGLALVRDISERHGGRVSVSSIPGRGSVFSIFLPKNGDLPEKSDAEEYDTGGSDESISSYWLADMNERAYFPGAGKNGGEKKGETVLIVEDSGALRGFLSSTLEGRYSVVLAANGSEGIKMAGKYLPNLVISDIMMPDMDGYEFTRAMKKNESLKDIPVILLSAKADMASKLEGFEAGAVDYVVKPFNNSELLARVEAQFEVKRLREKVGAQNTELESRKRELEDAAISKEYALRQLEADKAYFREMADGLPSIVFETDTEGIIRYLNQAAQKYFGELKKNSSIFDFLHPGDLDTFSEDFQGRFDKIGRKMYEYRFLLEKDTVFPVFLKGCAVFQGDTVERIRFLVIESDGSIDVLPFPDKAFYKEYGITNREREVLILVIRGASNKDICSELSVSEITVKKHITSLFQKTGQKNRRGLKEMIFSLFGSGR